MQSKISRRKTLAGAVALVVAPGLVSPLSAMSKAEATDLVDRLVADINKVVTSGESDAKIFVDFERIFRTYADVKTIARYGLGVEARSASKAQMRAFTKEFQGYIARKYGKQFKDFIGGEIRVKSTRKVKSFFEVKATAHLRGKSPVEIAFLVSDKSGKNLFFNLFVEGVNMLLAERTEIGAMLDRRRGNLDKMIGDLRDAG
tara:strand:+ start:204 stop:809 length:606 start_codon:yes stop_codon:yes gene_type:complete